MGNSSSFKEIEKKYGQNGIDYVAFRYHERRGYYRVKELINRLKDHINLQQQEALEFIDQEKRLLQEEFNKVKIEAETHNPDSIKIAEAQFKQPVEDFSGYSFELKRLEDLHLQVKTKYESEKASMEKRIRYEIMKEQNKSQLKGIEEFDDKSNSQRKSIENECIKLHPEKASENHDHDIESKYNWENERQVFDSIFDKEKTERESTEAREKVRDNILPAKKPVCC